MADHNSGLFSDLIGWLIGIFSILLGAITAVFSYMNSKFSARQKHVDKILEKYDDRMDLHALDIKDLKGQIKVLTAENLANQKEILNEIKNVNKIIELRLDEQNKAISIIQNQNEKFQEGITDFYARILPEKVEEEVKRQIKSAQ